jgi:paraquat-inducible protein B
VAEAPRALVLAAADARALLRNIDREVGLLSSEARASIGAVNAAAKRADRALSFEEGPPAEALKTLNATMADARASLARLDETLDSVRKAATDDRSLYQLRSALESLGETSRSLGSLLEYLNRHPEALLRGKAIPKER